MFTEGWQQRAFEVAVPNDGDGGAVAVPAPQFLERKKEGAVQEGKTAGGARGRNPHRHHHHLGRGRGRRGRRRRIRKRKVGHHGRVP